MLEKKVVQRKSFLLESVATRLMPFVVFLC